MRGYKTTAFEEVQKYFENMRQLFAYLTHSTKLQLELYKPSHKVTQPTIHPSMNATPILNEIIIASMNEASFPDYDNNSSQIS